jgi:hypothetical protein
MWQKYYNTHKDNDDLSLKAILWISRSNIKEGKLDEAKKLLSEHIKTRIANPANQQVEGLIQQLVSISAPKRRRVAAAAPANARTADAETRRRTAASTRLPRRPPELTFEDVEKSSKSC